MENMTIPIVKLDAKDWQKYKDLRLLALKSDPEAFGSSFEEEENLSKKDWQRRLSAMWFAKIDGKLAGLVGLIPGTNLSNKHIGHLVSLWVHPDFRGRSVAKALLLELQNQAQEPNLDENFPTGHLVARSGNKTI